MLFPQMALGGVFLLLILLCNALHQAGQGQGLVALLRSLFLCLGLQSCRCMRHPNRRAACVYMLTTRTSRPHSLPLQILALNGLALGCQHISQSDKPIFSLVLGSKWTHTNPLWMEKKRLRSSYPLRLK